MAAKVAASLIFALQPAADFSIMGGIYPGKGQAI
jgi:hypothetical protein